MLTTCTRTVVVSKLTIPSLCMYAWCSMEYASNVYAII
jgi:hypothetical protein